MIDDHRKLNEVVVNRSDGPLNERMVLGSAMLPLVILISETVTLTVFRPDCFKTAKIYARRRIQHHRHHKDFGTMRPRIPIRSITSIVSRTRSRIIHGQNR